MALEQSHSGKWSHHWLSVSHGEWRGQSKTYLYFSLWTVHILCRLLYWVFLFLICKTLDILGRWTFCLRLVQYFPPGYHLSFDLLVGIFLVIFCRGCFICCFFYCVQYLCSECIIQPRVQKQIPQKNNAAGGVQFITPGGAKGESPLSQGPDQFCENLVYPNWTCPNPTSPNSLKLVWTKEKKIQS